MVSLFMSETFHLPVKVPLVVLNTVDIRMVTFIKEGGVFDTIICRCGVTSQLLFESLTKTLYLNVPVPVMLLLMLQYASLPVPDLVIVSLVLLNSRMHPSTLTESFTETLMNTLPLRVV